MESWSVLIEARGDGTAAPDAAAVLLAELAPYSPSVAAGAGSWSARVFTEAGGPAGAAANAASLVLEAAGKAGLPAWPLVRAEAVREDVFDEDLGRAARAGAT